MHDTMKRTGRRASDVKALGHGKRHRSCFEKGSLAEIAEIAEKNKWSINHEKIFRLTYPTEYESETGVLFVSVHSGRNLPVMDFNSSDPYVHVFMCGNEKMEILQTHVVESSLNPKWDQSPYGQHRNKQKLHGDFKFFQEVLVSQFSQLWLQFKVMDHDMLGGRLA